MSQDTVRREIAAKRTYATQLEQRAHDAAHPLADPRHADRLLAEAARLRNEADIEERQLAARAARAAAGNGGVGQRARSVAPPDGTTPAS